MPWSLWFSSTICVSSQLWQSSRKNVYFWVGTDWPAMSWGYPWKKTYKSSPGIWYEISLPFLIWVLSVFWKTSPWWVVLVLFGVWGSSCWFWANLSFAQHHDAHHNQSCSQEPLQGWIFKTDPIFTQSIETLNLRYEDCPRNLTGNNETQLQKPISRNRKIHPKQNSCTSYKSA